MPTTPTPIMTEEPMPEANRALERIPWARRSRALMALTIAAIAVLVIGLLPSPYLVEQPGPTVDVLGETVSAEGAIEPVLSVEGADPYAGDATLRLLTVTILGNPGKPRNWLSLLPAVFDPAQTLSPMEMYFPTGTTAEDRVEQNEVLMVDSQTVAAAAALQYLGEPVAATLIVSGVAESGPAAGVLHAGDVIVAAEGERVPDFTALREAILGAGPARELDLTVERDENPVEVTVVPEIPDGGSSPMIGVGIATEYDLPVEVQVAVDDIGGPSAGLVFALAIVELLSPGTVPDDARVSATGTIDDRGAVGAIGGLEQKMWAASRAGGGLFLMPVANCDAVPDEIPPGIEVAPVATLSEAVAAIASTASESTESGEGRPGFERCGVAQAAG